MIRKDDEELLARYQHAGRRQARTARRRQRPPVVRARSPARPQPPSLSLNTPTTTASMIQTLTTLN